MFGITYGSWVFVTSIFSPISNKRQDKYGGNLKNRCRFLLEVGQLVRKNWPNNKILGARITGKDWIKNGINLRDLFI